MIVVNVRKTTLFMLILSLFIDLQGAYKNRHKQPYGQDIRLQKSYLEKKYNHEKKISNPTQRFQMRHSAKSYNKKLSKKKQLIAIVLIAMIFGEAAISVNNRINKYKNAIKKNDYTSKFTTEFIPVPDLKKHNVKKCSGDYIVNLLWVNANKSDYFSEYKGKDITHYNLQKAQEWADINEGCPIKVWYDSKFLNNATNTIQSVEAIIKKKSSKASYNCFLGKKKEMGNIILEDIRNLDYLNLSGDVVAVFSEKLPLFFRVDLLRMIIVYEEIVKNQAKISIYEDWDGTPMSSKELFDQETKNILNQYGLIMSRDEGGGYENGFFEMTNNRELLRVVKLFVIDLNIKRALNFLSNNDSLWSYKTLKEVVYYSIKPMFQYFYYLKGYGELDGCSLYSDEAMMNCGVIKNDAFHLFRLDLNDHGSDELLKICSGSYFCRNLNGVVPTKLIKIPPPSLNY
jgi:hypothetical protein